MATTNWYVPVAADITNVMSGVITGAVQVTGNSGDTADAFTAKMNFIIVAVVNKIRGAISKGNRTPLSATVNSVPPEGQQHVLSLVVESLVASTPNMTFALKDEFLELIKEAKAWIEKLKAGEPTDYPTDPISTNNAGAIVAQPGSAGDLVGEIDMSTDQLNSLPYAPPLPIGNVMYSGTVNPNGFQVANVGDQFSYYVNSQLTQIFTKQGTSGNNLNWV